MGGIFPINLYYSHLIKIIFLPIKQLFSLVLKKLLEFMSVFMTEIKRQYTHIVQHIQLPTLGHKN